jgi:HK97 family phage prohead protease
MIEYKDLSRVLEHDDDEGTLTAYASQFNVVDAYKDVVLPGAFKRTLNNRRSSKDKYLYPLLYQHDASRIIGGISEAQEDDYGLLYKASFNLDTQLGKDAYSNAKKGMLVKSSIGFDIPPKGAEYAEDDGDYVRYIKEVRLWEISLVTFPANPGAVVVDVKSSGKLAFPHFAKEGRTFSQSNLHKLSGHAASLRAMADELDLLLGNSNGKQDNTSSQETRADLDAFIIELRKIRERGE